MNHTVTETPTRQSRADDLKKSSTDLEEVPGQHLLEEPEKAIFSEETRGATAIVVFYPSARRNLSLNKFPGWNSGRRFQGH